MADVPGDASSALVVDIVIEQDAWLEIADRDAVIEQAARLAHLRSGAPGRAAAQVTVALLDDAGVQALNRQFRGQDKATNVLSFPASRPHAAEVDDLPSLGDIVLAYETVKREASVDGISFQDHLRHLVVHGVLHLVGFDHESDGEADVMESLETKILGELNVADPYRR